MNDVAENENKKVKETKEASEAESYESYENEEMENSGEGSEMGEGSLAASGVLLNVCTPPSGFSVVKDDRSGKKGSLKDLYEEKRENLIREKWLSVTGRRPRNWLNVKRFRAEGEFDQTIFFGSRRPAELDRKRIEKWTKQVAEMRKVRKPLTNFGKVRREIRVPASDEGILSVCFAPNAESLATAFRSGAVQVRRAFTGDILAPIHTFESVEKLAVRSLIYHPFNTDKLYVGGSSGRIQVFDTGSSEMHAMHDQGEEINNMDISSNGYYLVTVGRDGLIWVNDANTLEVITRKFRPKVTDATQSTIEDEYHKLRVYGLKFHPKNSNLFVTGGWDHTVKLWDVRAPAAILNIKGPFICGDSVDIQDDLILTGSWRVSESLQLWHFSTGKLFKTIPIEGKSTDYEGEFLYTAKFFKKGNNQSTLNQFIVVCGSGNTETLVINIETGKIAAIFPSYRAALTLDTYSNYVVYGGTESLLRICEFIPPSSVTRARKKENLDFYLENY